MSPDNFALWKFKTIEGLIYCNGYDFFTTKIVKGSSTFYIKYDLKTEEATISNPDDTFMIEHICPFNKLQDELKNMGLWKERPKEEQHHWLWDQNV